MNKQENMYSHLLVAQMILFFFSIVTGVAALLIRELFVFIACLICDLIIYHNIVLIRAEVSDIWKKELKDKGIK